MKLVIIIYVSGSILALHIRAGVLETAGNVDPCGRSISK